MVAITGATGFVGSALVAALLREGVTVRVLTRDSASARRALSATASAAAAAAAASAATPTRLPAPPPLAYYDEARWGEAVRGAGGVVNLAGEQISTRWSDAQKESILSSRLGATNRVVQALRACPPSDRPRVLVQASAVGFYGTSASARFDEASGRAPHGGAGDFLARVCASWEGAAQPAAALGVRLVVLRLGVVLDAGGGALARMAPLFQAFIGGVPGDGRQWFSWVHRCDAVAVATRALRDAGPSAGDGGGGGGGTAAVAAAMSGAYNVTAPRPVRMRELCRELGDVVGRPSWLPVPGMAVTLLLGEGATAVLDGQQVVPARLQADGFPFRFRDVRGALQAIVRGAGGL